MTRSEAQELQKIKMQINTLIDIEETKLRLALQLEQEPFQLFKLELLANFRPGASLRQINNQRKVNLQAQGI